MFHSWMLNKSRLISCFQISEAIMIDEVNGRFLFELRAGARFSRFLGCQSVSFTLLSVHASHDGTRVAEPVG